MLAIKNKTPFAVSSALQTDKDGYDHFCVFVSTSFVLRQNKWLVLDTQMPCPLTDVLWQPDEASSIRYPSQLSFNKPGTDVILNCHAIAPQKKPVSALRLEARIAHLAVSAIVFGDRHWHDGKVSAALPYLEMPVVWERAYGGTARDPLNHGQLLSHDQNPFGKGWIPPQGQCEDGLALPNIENERGLIQRSSDQPPPLGFSALSPHTLTRAQFAGTYDHEWQQTRAPFLPIDFDPRFFHAAIPALRYPGMMRGNEPVQLRNMNREAEVSFSLPGVYPAGSVRIKNSTHSLQFTLETVVIETKDLITRLFWQASVPAARSLASIKTVSVW